MSTRFQVHTSITLFRELIKWFIVLDDPVVGYLLHVGRVGIFVIGIMNFFLLWRCIHSDFLKTQKSNLIE